MFHCIAIENTDIHKICLHRGQMRLLMSLQIDRMKRRRKKVHTQKFYFSTYIAYDVLMVFGLVEEKKREKKALYGSHASHSFEF